MTPLQQVLALIPKLAPAECQTVMGAIKAVGTMPSEELVFYYEDKLLEAIGQELARRGLVPAKNPLQVLRYKTTAMKTYAKKRGYVEAYLNDLAAKEDLDADEQRQLLFLLVRAYAEQKLEQDLLSVHGMLTGIDRIPDVLMRAFPGYAEAGLLRFLVRRRG